MTTAIAEYIRAILPSGSEFIDGDAALSFKDILESSFKDSANTTPIFFILSPGADPVKEVESMGKKAGYTANFNFHNIAMGQVRTRAQRMCEVKLRVVLMLSTNGVLN
ncbi:dynein heavy chain family protein [Toxoplasma gondii MAS]|uniref:Dynein heavy chain family protein n=3 Tax=Toxoplasma gondii TaxID=5811 RepID=A0A086PIC2_TOXGO|nr:dynein heavy chain family protein [Toxoplasma gondii p89]KFH00104.1 dynein heavy chain family protein [Toxoplasma gondii MAS]PUA83224.1 dynein heavy chain family protein [Toxoplasma gondii TgCATBr9]